MPADRLLTTVLRAYQDPLNPAETDKIFATTNMLLTNLNNPLNLSLLTAHFLTARAIWQLPDGLRTCLRIISIYNTAAINVRRNELHNANAASGQPPAGSGVHAEEWARVIAKGLDDKTSRWTHTLVLAGILMGMEADERRSLSWSLRSTLEQAVVTAANLALEDPIRTGPLGRGAVVLALTYAFPLLSESAKQLLNCNALLPAAIEAMVGEEGFQHGDFIQAISNDVAPERSIVWYTGSPSVARLQKLESHPLAQNMGPLSRLVAFAVQNATDSSAVLHVQEELLAFTAGLLEQWEQCALSRIDLSVEAMTLSPEILQGPWPTLWELLKKIMYTVVATLQPIVGRSLLDPHLRNAATAPTVTLKTLHILRHLSFISSRQGANAFQVYTFTYLTTLDILTRYSDACASFLQETQPPLPSQAGGTSPSPVTQALTLFYLNTAEHLPLSLPTPACESLIIGPATAYLSPGTTTTATNNATTPSLTLELFESAHAAILSVMSCPQHSSLTVSLIPFYIDALLSAFPLRISPRQFRLAFRTVVQIAGPPFPIAASHPALSETLLEMLRFRASPAEGGASTSPLPPDQTQTQLQQQQQQQPAAAQQPPPDAPLSEQTTLVLALIDALPHLPLPILEDWLSRAADAMNCIADAGMREAARRRFWDVLVSGEMDVERAAVGVAWWGTRGGREMVLSGGRGRGGGDDDGAEFLMSGALGQGEGSRL
ncbi:Uu.00g061260.m01.CDS01 [Anthostomella pinea]|uniref:Uu.00g061260.m01.CDS01 n=1 Tax=Anthostomella pinea TaxID=933095 RepID=A0AAI8VSD0_9PEZI|nr:Uu.00g061260.m01.CDS01 [Anthostomella pinea]